MVRPAGSAGAVHVKLEPVLPTAVNVTGAYSVLYSPFGSSPGETVIAGHDTVSAKFCTASGTMPLAAVNCGENEPNCVGVPTSAVPLKFRPVGRAPPVCVIVGAGKPLAVTPKFTAVPTVTVVLFPLVNSGACCTFNVKFCVTGPPP